MVSISSPLPANSLRYVSPFSSLFSKPAQAWQGSLDQVAWQDEEIYQRLQQIEQPCYIVRNQDRIGVAQTGRVVTDSNGHAAQTELLAMTPAIALGSLGDPSFCTAHNTQYAYMAGAMAGGIASEALVIALGRAKMLACFGSGGLGLDRIESAISTIQQALPNGPYSFNLLHNPHEPAVESATVDLYLKHRVATVEASAFLTLTPSIVYYRVAGLRLNAASQIECHNRVIAKVSRQEVAVQFMRPAPAKILRELIAQGLITEQQARWAELVPMADDITVEADSGGHTDNRPLVCLLPAMLAIRDQIQAERAYTQPVRIGAAGGIATPQSLLSALMMGAAYGVTGSVNQSCLEAGTSDTVKALLAQAEMADIMMAPAADMFEMGVKLQVLKKGTLFPMRAQKLYDTYKGYDAIEQIPLTEQAKLEKQVFRPRLDPGWENPASYLAQRKPRKLARAQKDPKLKMALMFRWYLGLSSRWARTAEVERQLDYQIWCGPAMGAFNQWVKGTYLAAAESRRVVDVAYHMMMGAAIAYRIQSLRLQGLQLPAHYAQYRPVHAVVGK